MYHSFTEEELRSYCRQSIESLEMWARRLIHEEMTKRYGDNYVDYKISSENYLIKKEVREHIHWMLQNEPGRFHRAVDTLFFEHIIYFLCHPMFYRDMFGKPLKCAYPNGKEETRVFLERLTPVRNALSHSNPISVRQAEQAICYSHDFVDGLKKYYKEKGEEQMWNVPHIIRITDSLGNVINNPAEKSSVDSVFQVKQEMHFGDTYSVNVEIDTAFDENEYDIIWKNQNREVKEFNNKKSFVITFDESDISEVHTIVCIVISHKPWHKYQHHDCRVTLLFSVYPPM